MNEMRKFAGIIPPVVTVFDAYGEIQEDKTAAYIKSLVSTGIHGIFVGGSTGEAPLMTTEQRKQVIDIGVEASDGRLPVLAGTGYNSTKMTIELSKYAQHAGADGVVVSVPHYPKPTQEGIYRHYQAIAESVDIPLFAYNYPEQYGLDIEPETVARLAEDGYILGIKDTHADLDHTADIIRLTGNKITVWQGYDTKILPALCIGADGAVCTIGNVIPHEMVAIYSLHQQGKVQEAARIQLSIFGLIHVLSCRHDMQPLKEALKMLGYDVGDALMPATRVSAGEKEIIRKALVELGKLK